MSVVPAEIDSFLVVRTPEEWLSRAPEELDVLLLDHANCEMKAASSAISMIYRYPEHATLVQKMSRLAREELRHFEQVQKHIEALGIERRKLGPGNYAGGLAALVSEREPDRLRQRLIVGAIIEARSCERFARIANLLPDSLADFYQGLLDSEARHFLNYLELAWQHAGIDRKSFDDEVARFCSEEAKLIESPDPVFRFHSGLPSVAA